MSVSPGPDNSCERSAVLRLLGAFGIIRQFPVLIPLAFVALLSEMNYSGINSIIIPEYISGLPNLAVKEPRIIGWLTSTLLTNEARVIGWLTGVFLLFETLSRIPAGRLSDRYGRSRMILAALVLSFPSFLLGGLVPNYLYLFPLRAWDGVMQAVLGTSIFAVVSDAVPERNRSNAMGVVNTMFMAGIMVGYAVAIGIVYLTEHQHPRWFFFVEAGVVAVGALVALLVFRKFPQLNEPHPEVHAEDQARTPLDNFQQVPLLMITFLQYFALTMIVPFLYIYLTKSLGLPLWQLALLLGPPLVVVGALSIPLSHIADIIGKRNALRVAFTIMGSTIWLFAVVHQLWLLSLIAAVIGAAFAIGGPALLAIQGSLSCSSERGATIGRYGTVQGVASVMGPIIGGYIYNNTQVGPPALFIGVTVIASLAALLAWFAAPAIESRSMKPTETV